MNLWYASFYIIVIVVYLLVTVLSLLLYNIEIYFVWCNTKAILVMSCKKLRGSHILKSHDYCIKQIDVMFQEKNVSSQIERVKFKGTMAKRPVQKYNPLHSTKHVNQQEVTQFRILRIFDFLYILILIIFYYTE